MCLILLVVQHAACRRCSRQEACSEQEEKKRAGQNSSPSIFGPKPSMPRWEDFPEIKEGEKVYQKNEGEWEFFIDESDDCCAIVLEVTLGKYMDTTLVKVRSYQSLISTDTNSPALLTVLDDAACTNVE